MGLVLVTPPAKEPVSVGQMESHLRACGCSSGLGDIAAYIAAAREYAENYTDRAFITQTWKLTLDRFPGGCNWPWSYALEAVIELPKPPLQSVTSVKYYDSANALQTLSSAKYQVDATSEVLGRVVPVYGEVWPDTYERMASVEVQFKAGYGDAPANVPPTIRQAIMLLAAHWYEIRQPVVLGGGQPAEIPMTVTSLLNMNSAGIYV